MVQYVWHIDFKSRGKMLEKVYTYTKLQQKDTLPFYTKCIKFYVITLIQTFDTITVRFQNAHMYLKIISTQLTTLISCFKFVCVHER